MEKENGFIFTFSGAAGSGKDTFVKMLIQKIKEYSCIYAPKYLQDNMLFMTKNNLTIDMTAMSFAFADEFKSIFKRNFGYLEENKSDFRSDLQFFGTEIGREYSNDFWTWGVLNEIEMISAMTPCKIFFITDTRFQNELDVKAAFIKTFNVYINGGDHRNQMTEDQKSHASEKMSNDTSINYDFVISNNGTLEDLEEKAKILAIEILKKVNELNIYKNAEITND